MRGIHELHFSRKTIIIIIIIIIKIIYVLSIKKYYVKYQQKKINHTHIQSNNYISKSFSSRTLFIIKRVPTVRIKKTLSKILRTHFYRSYSVAWLSFFPIIYSFLKHSKTDFGKKSKSPNLFSKLSSLFLPLLTLLLFQLG